MLTAIQTHSGTTLTSLPTGHVQVLGSADACAAAMALIDNLVDEDGAATKETLAAHLVVAEPFSGVMHVPCSEDWAGAVIGKGGAGLKAIAQESGATINYVDPEEQAQEEAKGGGAEADGAAPAEEGKGEGKEGEKGGFFRISAKFENQCQLAAKRIEERLALVQRLDSSLIILS